MAILEFAEIEIRPSADILTAWVDGKFLGFLVENNYNDGAEGHLFPKNIRSRNPASGKKIEPQVGAPGQLDMGDVMPWVRFTERFRWSPPELNNTWTKVFPAGYVGLVPGRCADAAIEAGKAEATQRPRSQNGAKVKSSRP